MLQVPKSKVKSILITILLALLAISIGFSFILKNRSNLNAYAEERTGGSGASTATDSTVNEVDIPINNFLAEYYFNLTGNFAYNPANFCVYVSLAMMLSYYDTWWNDDVVPEFYDENGILDAEAIESPGIFSNLPNSFINEESFYEYLDGCGKRDFMMALLGSDNHKKTINAVSLYEGLLYKEDGSIRDTLQKVGLDQLFEFSLFSPQTDLSEITSFLDNQHPIMMGIEQHAVVAFAYKKVGQDYIIYAHNGYDGTKYPRLISFNATEIKYAYVLVPTEQNTHNHSYNYYDDIDFCPCELEEHPAHNQEHHTFSNTGYENTHTETCDIGCGVVTEEHVFVYKEHTQSTHTMQCQCGVSKTVWHSYTLTYVDEATHKLMCECGFVAITEHDFEYEYISGFWHELHCECFNCYIEASEICTEHSEPHYPYFEAVVIDGRLYNMCTLCGYIEQYTN